MATGSRIGFHASYVQQNGQNKENGLGNALVGAYLNQLGLSQAAISYISAAPPEGMTWLTSEDAIRVGIEVAVVDSSDRELRERLNPGAMKRIENSDILGHDLKRMPIRGLTVEECERECALNSDCKAFTFNTRHSACFLKSNAARAYTTPGAQSGYKADLEGKILRSTVTITEQIDLPGGDYRELNRSELRLCADVCENDGKCVAFTYVSNLRRCWLKSSVPPSMDARHAISGFKVAH
jgi:PAN domain